MSDKDTPLLERVANYYTQLSTVAADLNAVSDELGKSITEIDFALKKLNLGITTWVTIQSDDGDPTHDNFSYWSREIGYARIDGKWGICLRKVDGCHFDPDNDKVEEWRFNDAPRSLRLEAINKIPDLLETLYKDATRTIKDIRARIGETQAVVKVIKGVASSPIRKAVCEALVNAGHISAAQLLTAGSWTLDGQYTRIEVTGIGKKMLALTVNAAAEKIIREELVKLDAPLRLRVDAAEITDQTGETIQPSSPVTVTLTEVK